MRFVGSRCLAFAGAASLAFAIAESPAAEPIDRRALVTRHNPVLARLDAESPLSVGNGEFAFTADVTGLQTFPEAYEETIPLGTQAQWGWHTAPNPNHWSIERFRVRRVREPTDARSATPTSRTTSARPRSPGCARTPIGCTWARWASASRRPTAPPPAPRTSRTWSRPSTCGPASLKSRFVLEGQPVEVLTLCHPQRDLVAVRVVSPLAAPGPHGGRTAISLRHRRGHRGRLDPPRSPRDASTELGHRRASFVRKLDEDAYAVARTLEPGRRDRGRARSTSTCSPPRRMPTALELAVAFAPKPDRRAPELRRPRRPRPASIGATSGARAARSTSRGSKRPALARAGAAHRALAIPHRDPVRRELAAAGDRPHLQQLGRQVPPGDALVARRPLRALESHADAREAASATTRRSCRARESTAQRQGYAGARWPKMTGPNGDESPSTVGPVPDLAAAASDLLRRARLSRSTRARDAREIRGRRLRDRRVHGVVSRPGTRASDRYVLGPPCCSARKRSSRKTHTLNAPSSSPTGAGVSKPRRNGASGSACRASREWDRVLAKLAQRPRSRRQIPLRGNRARHATPNPRWTTTIPP